MNLRLLITAGILCLAFCAPSSAREGIRPAGHDGRPLNLDFEDGTLKDWTPAGRAFEGQPVRGDTVSKRRGHKSGHQGNFWIGTYEIVGDDPQGTLTSAPFKVTHPYASFLVAGGEWPETRVELVRADENKVFFKVSGRNHEGLRPVVVDLKAHQGKEIFIRVVDERSGHWGHINFDDFKFHARKPNFPNALDPRQANEVPDVDVVKHAGLSPEEAARAATMPPDFSLTLFAGEPDVRQPIAMALDERGRVWIGECHTYPVRAPDGQGTDRILVFEDTNGDGKFNRRTVFMEGLNLLTGMEVGFGGVWIGAPPYLMYVPIADGDEPKPAGEPEILLDGWGWQDTHETLNTFKWGPDGWLYGCHGVFTHSKVGKPGAPDSERERINAGIWRYHPIRHVFEVFAHGTSNPWGIDFDDYGQCFIEVCVIPHLFHVVQGARYHRQAGQHFNPHTYDDIKTIGDHVHYAGNRGPHAGNHRSDSAGGGHAHAGLMVYLGDSWPDEYRGKIFMNNISGFRLNMDIPERRGSGFVGRHGPDFLFFNDRWSQVLNFLYDQNGSVYIIDWYDRQQCHNRNPDDHDRSNGRIFKMVYNNQPWTPVDLRKKSDLELVQLQLHKNDWHVRHSRKILQERGPNPAVHSALLNILNSNPDSTRQVRALWALHATGGLTEKIALAQLRSGEEYIRAWTVQLLAEDKQVSNAALKEFARMAREDESPVARLYLASAAQRIADEKRWDILEGLHSRSEDAGDHNIPLMVWYASEPLADLDADRALRMAAGSKLPRVLDFMTRRVLASGTPEARSLVVRHLSDLPDERRQSEMLSGLAAGFRGQPNVPMPDGWDRVESRIGKSKNADIRAQVMALSLTFGSPAALAELRETLRDGTAEPAIRRTALESLLNVRDPELPPVLQALLSDTALRGAALRALASYDHPQTPSAVIGAYGSMDEAHRRDALNTLASRLNFARPLLAAIEAETISSRHLTAELVRQLRSFNNAELNQQIERLWGVHRETSADMKKEIARYRAIYRAGGSQPGDASRGREVYNRICAQCHILFDVGGKVGPDLTGSQRADLDYILENTIDPNAVIPNEYRTSMIEMKDDRFITGIISQQNENSVTVLTANETLVLPRNEIESIEQSEFSMMPEGLLEGLSDQEVRDLIFYLRSPGQVPLPES